MDFSKMTQTNFSIMELWALHQCMRKDTGEELSKDIMVEVWAALLEALKMESMGQGPEGTVAFDDETYWMVTRKVNFSLSIGGKPVGMEILKKVIPVIMEGLGKVEGRTEEKRDMINGLLDGVELEGDVC